MDTAVSGIPETFFGIDTLTQLFRAEENCNYHLFFIYNCMKLAGIVPGRTPGDFFWCGHLCAMFPGAGEMPRTPCSLRRREKLLVRALVPDRFE